MALAVILDGGQCITGLGKYVKLATMLAYIRSAPTVTSLLCDKVKISKRRSLEGFDASRFSVLKFCSFRVSGIQGFRDSGF